jgi:hypothetical protein
MPISSRLFLVVDQHWARSAAHDLWRLVQAKQHAKKARVMAARDDQVSVKRPSQPRDPLGGFADQEHRFARFAPRADRVRQARKVLFGEPPLLRERVVIFLRDEFVGRFRREHVYQGEPRPEPFGDLDAVACRGFGMRRKVHRDDDFFDDFSAGARAALVSRVPILALLGGRRFHSCGFLFVLQTINQGHLPAPR